MTALIAVLWALIGFIAALFVGLAIGPAFGFRHMEGSSAIFAVTIAGPVGALLGLAVGCALTRRFADPASRRKILMVTLTAMGAVVAISVILEKTRVSDRVSQSASTINFEIRLPPGMKAPSRKEEAQIELRSAKDNGKAQIYDGLWLREEDGRAVIRGYVEFFHATPERTIAARIGTGPTWLFKLRIPARPKSSPGLYEAWFPVDGIEGDGPSKASRLPKSDEAAEIRHFQTIRD